MNGAKKKKPLMLKLIYIKLKGMGGKKVKQSS